MRGIKPRNPSVQFGLEVKINVQQPTLATIWLVITRTNPDAEVKFSFKDHFPTSQVPPELMKMQSFFQAEPDLGFIQVVERCLEIMLTRNAQLEIIFDTEDEEETTRSISLVPPLEQEVAITLSVRDYIGVMTFPLKYFVKVLVATPNGGDSAA
jgi:hypothetical protein